LRHSDVDAEQHKTNMMNAYDGHDLATLTSENCAEISQPRIGGFATLERGCIIGGSAEIVQ